MQTIGLYQDSHLVFSLAEVAEITEVSENNLYNWNKRGIIQVLKDRYSGRGIFTPADVLLIALIRDLAFHCAVDPKHSGACVGELVSQWMTHCESGKAAKGQPLEIRVTLQGFESQPMVFTASQGRDRFPYITIPVDIIASDVADAMFNHLRRKRQQEKREQ